MFDFEHWREWLEQKAGQLRRRGLDAEFRGGDHVTPAAPKPKHDFRLRTDAALGQLELWASGECDYDIMDASSKMFVDHTWGLCVTDETFEAIFDRFVRSAQQVGPQAACRTS